MNAELQEISPVCGTTQPKKSILLPLGIVLVILGLVVPSPLSQAASHMVPGTLRSVVFISTDVFRLFFFAGIVCAIIGVIRNRKKKPISEPPADVVESNS